METENIDLLGVNHNSALNIINVKELDDCIIKFGSFLSIVQTKKINATSYLVILLKNEKLRSILLEMTGIDTFQELVREMMSRYPILCKSKIVYSNIKKKKNDRRKY